MKLLTNAIRAKIPALYSGEEIPLADKVAVAKFFNPLGSHRWYVLEGGPEEDDFVFFGYVTGADFDELGYFTLKELESIKLRFGLGIERDISFSPKKMRDIPDVAKSLGLAVSP